MEYDFLKIKQYQERVEKEADGNEVYILSFDNKHHLKVSSLAKKIMDCFDGKKTSKEIIDELHSRNIMLEDSDFYKFVNDILMKNSLIDGMNFDSIKKDSSKLWVHIPLCSSNKFKKLYSILKVFYKKKVFIATVILIVICMGYNIVDSLAKGSLNLNLDSTNSLEVLLIFYFSLISHEIGHITAASKYNTESGKIGIGIYLFNPVVYVDMTNSWRLNKKGRVLVDIGGVYFQTIIIIPLTILAIITNDYTIKLTTVVITFVALTNFMPFLKLDGYWLLTDALALVNVNQKSIGFVKSFLYVIFKEHRIVFKSNRKKLNTKEKIYCIYGAVYLISTVVMFIFGVSMAISVIGNYKEVIEKLHLIYHDIYLFNIGNLLSDINKIFILIFPLLFIIYFIYEFSKGISKGIIDKVLKK